MGKNKLLYECVLYTSVPKCAHEIWASDPESRFCGPEKKLILIFSFKLGYLAILLHQIFISS